MIDLTQKLDSHFFPTLESLVEYQAETQLMMNEPQNLVDDEAVTRFVFSPKEREASRLSKQFEQDGIFDTIQERYEKKHLDCYGHPFPRQF